MFPESPKEINEQEKTIEKSLSTLKSEIDKPWQVKYLKESKDKKYNIYGYKLVQWGTKWWIKNQYIKQIWTRIEWTKFTDANGNEIKKDKFIAWEIVFLRVPKKEKNESQKTPWKFEYVRNTKDKDNRNWKVYRYTFSEWGTLWWVSNKRDAKMWISLAEVQPYKFCDANWNELKKKRFNKWETVYIKIANADIIDPTPEMSKEEIMKISDNDLIELNNYYHNNRYKIWHKDKLWHFIKLNNKKLYLEYSNPQHNWSYIYLGWWDGLRTISIYRKTWNKYQWIYYDTDSSTNVYRWELKYNSWWWAVPINWRNY